MRKSKHNHPNFEEEGRLWRKGYNFVVGLDEVGRGPLAGPVVACAICFGAPKQIAQARFQIPFGPSLRREPNSKFRVFDGIRDSKKLSPKQRENWYKILASHRNIKWGIGIVSEKIIDKINIFEATKLAMRKAVKALECEAEYLLLDGNFTLEDLPINQKAIVRGDEKIFSCAAASIIAKVTRDRIMVKYHKKFPQYKFDKHKGYGTKDHISAIKKNGVCSLHRLSFKPCQEKSKHILTKKAFRCYHF